MQDHALRQVLHNEVHARPPEPMEVPLSISHIVMWTDRAGREASRQHLARLLSDHHLASPGAETTHLRVDLGSWRLRWEMHTEFVSWTFMREAKDDALSQTEPPTALQVVPQDWLQALPGSALAKLHLWAMPARALDNGNFARILQEDSLVASTLSDGQAEIHTALGGVGQSATQLFGGDLFVGHGLDHLGAGHEHVGRVFDHEDEVGQGRRVHRTTGRRPHDHADLRNHTRGHDVALEHLGIAAQRRHALPEHRLQLVPAQGAERAAQDLRDDAGRERPRERRQAVQRVRPEETGHWAGDRAAVRDGRGLTGLHPRRRTGGQVTSGLDDTGPQTLPGARTPDWSVIASRYTGL